MSDQAEGGQPGRGLVSGGGPWRRSGVDSGSVGLGYEALVW